MGEGHFRVLSLDGGGSWALIEVKTLMKLYPEAKTGHDVLRHFDVAVANSGGSIVLAALAVNMELERILELFMTRDARRKMFVNLPEEQLDRLLAIGPRYRTLAKLEGLSSVLGPEGDEPMGSWKLTNDEGRPVRLLICALDYERLRKVLFRTRPEAAEEPPIAAQRAVINATFAQAAHASTNAPVNYFDAPASFGAARFWDGAMAGFNNPILAGIVDALCDGTVDRSTVRALSLGTGSVVLPELGSEEDQHLVLPRRGDGLLTYLKTVTSCVLDDPPDSASYVAHVMLGGREPRSLTDVVTDGPVVRMNPLLQPLRANGNRWELPDGLSASDFRALADLDMDAVADDEVRRIAQFADLWLAGKAGDPRALRNQPIRSSRWLEVQIGHGTFGEAALAWKEPGGREIARAPVVSVREPAPAAAS